MTIVAPEGEEIPIRIGELTERSGNHPEMIVEFSGSHHAAFGLWTHHDEPVFDGIDFSGPQVGPFPTFTEFRYVGTAPPGSPEETAAVDAMLRWTPGSPLPADIQPTIHPDAIHTAAGILKAFTQLPPGMPLEPNLLRDRFRMIVPERTCRWLEREVEFVGLFSNPDTGSVWIIVRQRGKAWRIESSERDSLGTFQIVDAPTSAHGQLESHRDSPHFVTADWADL